LRETREPLRIPRANSSLSNKPSPNSASIDAKNNRIGVPKEACHEIVPELEPEEFPGASPGPNLEGSVVRIQAWWL